LRVHACSLVVGWLTSGLSARGRSLFYPKSRQIAAVPEEREAAAAGDIKRRGRRDPVRHAAWPGYRFC